MKGLLFLFLIWQGEKKKTKVTLAPQEPPPPTVVAEVPPALEVAVPPRHVDEGPSQAVAEVLPQVANKNKKKKKAAIPPRDSNVPPNKGTFKMSPQEAQRISNLMKSRNEDVKVSDTFIIGCHENLESLFVTDLHPHSLLYFICNLNFLWLSGKGQFA